MQKAVCRLAGMALALVSLVTSADELTGYVQNCQNELGFAPSDVPSLRCNDGVLFDRQSTTPIRDYVGHARIKANVDLVFACRWINRDNPEISTTAVSIEMLIHNRQNGATCFFAAKDFSNPPPGTDTRVSSSIVSPTAANASSYWMQPAEIENKTFKFHGVEQPNTRLRCVGCHVAGPYIASRSIAPFLAQYGLLSDGHDTYATRYRAVLPPPPTIAGIPAGPSSFANWNLIIQLNNSLDNCASACHSIGSKSTAGTIADAAGQHSADLQSFTLIPSIKDDITNVTSLMPPFNQPSHFRWMNLDTPDDGIESETFADAKLPTAPAPVPGLMQYCANSSSMEAHAVGVHGNFSFSSTAMSQIPDRLKTFNLKEGLVCLNSDQETGRSCSDYAIRYMCASNTSANVVNITATWSDWYNTDSPTGDGDHEERSRHQNICGGVKPIAVQVQVVGNSNYVMGPNDRLARLSRYALTCKNSDQVDGRCSNYVVRHECTDLAPPIFLGTVTNVFAVGKQVTAASGSLTKGQAHNNAWNTQTWTIAPVTNTEYVRLKNTSNNGTVYLNVTSTAEQATVGTAALNSTATGQMWTVESIFGSNHVRFKNLLSGLYLTMADPRNHTSTPDYLPIYSQGLNTGWTSQRWIIQ